MAIEKVNPLGDRVLVKREDADEKSPGGIIIPDNAKEKPAIGKVVAVGPGAWVVNHEDERVRQPVAVAVGQRVLFGKYAGTEIEINGQKLTMLREDDLFAIVE